MNDILKAILIVFILLLGLNLIWTISNLDTSFIFKMSNTTLNEQSDFWAIRGQIGDIMSGHFSALAFLAVALSIILQNEANKQMRESIDKQKEALSQQGKSLNVQSDSLKAQIEELKASREESSKQTEEFTINNLNTKLNRYYKILDNFISEVSWDTINEYKIAQKGLERIPNNTSHQNVLNNTSMKMNNVLLTLNLIYNELEDIHKSSPNVYSIFIGELRLKLFTNVNYKYIKENYDRADKCLAFSLFES